MSKSSAEPWYLGADPAARRTSPAALRNREPLAEVLATVLPARGTVLEIASGSGEHVVHFAARFPALTWQPSDPDEAARASIAAICAEAAPPNVRAPLALDAQADAWGIDQADAVVCINMVHISPWTATLAMLGGAARLLPVGAPLVLYGPYERVDVPTAASNLAFDRSLKSRDPAWGLRLLDDVIAAASERMLGFESLVEMPANNITVLFSKRG